MTSNLLSPAERDVVVLLAEGKRQAEIAKRLYCTRRTVDVLLDHARKRYGCLTTAQLMFVVGASGLLEEAP